MRITLAYVFITLIWADMLLGQTPTNTPKANPFEVSARIVSGPKASSIDTFSNVQDTSLLAVDTNAVTSSNPFEVNHIPLRKSKQVAVSNSPLQDISKVKPQISNQFVFWIMIFSWAILAIVISSKTNLISYLLRSVFNINMMKLTKRDEASNNSFLLGLMYIVFLINFSVFIYLLQKYYTSQEGIKIWTLCFLAISAIYLIRHLSMWLLGQIFPVEKESSLYNYIILVFNIMFGICVIPLNLMLKYGPESLTKPLFIAGIALFAIYYIIRNLRGLSISIYIIGQGLVSFFIYLCVFEIAPILIIVRAILNLKGI